MVTSRETVPSATRRSVLRASGVAASAYALGSAGVLSGALSGCSSESAADTIRVIVPEGGLSRAFTAAARDFEESSGQSVEIITHPYGEARQQQLLELSGGTGGLDAVMIDGGVWLAELYEHLEPVDDRIDDAVRDRFVSSMPGMFERDGSVYALPFRVGGWVLIYRADLFDDAGVAPPETWADFRAAAEALTAGDQYGFAAPLAQTNFLVAQWVPMLWSFGGEILTPDHGSAAFNNEAGREATAFLAGLYHDGLVPPGAIEADHDGVITALQQGRAAMAITYSPYFLEVNDPEQSEFAGNFAVAGSLPYWEDSDLQSGRSMLAGWGVGIARDSDNKDGVWELVEYLTSDDVQKSLALEHGNSPTVRSVYQDDEYVEVYDSAGDVLEVLETASTRPGVVEWSRIEEALALRLSEVVAGDRSADEAMSDAETDVNDLLAG